MKFKVLDIVGTAPGYRGDVFVITEVDPTRPKNQYNGVSLRNFKPYRLSDKELAEKRIGQADPDWNKVTAKDGAQTNQVDQTFLNGQRRAERELQNCGHTDNLKRWEILAKAQPDEQIKARVRGEETTLKLKYVTTGGYKFVFVAETENGTQYRFPLNVIVI